MVGIIGFVDQSIQKQHLIRLHRPPCVHDMALSFEDGDPGQGLGEEHAGRTIHDHAQGAVLPMLTEQDHRLPEVWVPQGRRGNQEDTLSQCFLHTSILPHWAS